jgi:hypothetical protein
MSDREKYEEAKKVLSQIRHTLDTEPLTADQRKKLEIHAAALAGLIMHPWLPMSWARRLIMVAIVLLGGQQAIWAGNFQPLVWWLLLPFFSPRIVGYGAYSLGVLSRFLRGSTASTK